MSDSENSGYKRTSAWKMSCGKILQKKSMKTDLIQTNK